MMLSVEITDETNRKPIPKREIDFHLPAIVKHLALSGCYFMPNEHKLFRSIGMFFHYGYYLQNEELNESRFSVPPNCIYDPTEKSHFSNLIGKAIADFLSKKIDNSIFTINYESALKVMRKRIKKANRPDLLAISRNNGIFAIEAKGSDRYTDYCMNKAKSQSKKSEFTVDFCVASVACKLYKKVECKYHRSMPDNNTISNGIKRDELLKGMNEAYRDYHSRFHKFIGKNHLNKKDCKFQGVEFYEIDLAYGLEECFDRSILKAYSRFLKFYKPKLIVPKNIEKLSIEDSRQFEYNNEEIYIDSDGIGIKLDYDKEKSFFEQFD